MPKVYRFQKYDISADEMVTSKRYATREAIENINATALEHTEIEVDGSALHSDIEGMTRRGFLPSRNQDEFPRQVFT